MTRTNRERWLSAALEILTEHGAQALTIEQLTERVGRTKGSFYHHFQHLAAFKSALLDHIEQVGYTTVVRNAEQAQGPRARLASLADQVSRAPPAGEKALRGWAASDPEVAGLVERLDRERLAYLENLLHDITRDRERARLLARLTYATYLGALQLHPLVDGPQLRRMLAELETLTTEGGTS